MSFSCTAFPKKLCLIFHVLSCTHCPDFCPSCMAIVYSCITLQFTPTSPFSLFLHEASVLLGPRSLFLHNPSLYSCMTHQFIHALPYISLHFIPSLTFSLFLLYPSVYPTLPISLFLHDHSVYSCMNLPFISALPFSLFLHCP